MNDNYPCPETDGESIVVDDKNISTTPTTTTAMIQVQLHPIYSTTTTTTQQEQQEENVDFIQVSITEKSPQEATTTTTLVNMEEKEPAEQQQEQQEQQEMEEYFISLSIQCNNNNDADDDDNDKRIRIELKSRFENDEQQSSAPSSQEDEEEEAQPALLMDSSTEKENSQTMDFSSTENDHEHFSFTTDSQKQTQEQETTLDQNDTDDIKKDDDQNENENTIVTLPSEEDNSSSFKDEEEISFESDQTMPNDETSNGGGEKEEVETAKDEEELAVEEKEEKEATLNFGEDNSHDNGIEKHDNNDVNISNTDADTNIYVEKSGSDNVDESQQFAFEKDDNDAWGDEKVVFDDHQTNAADDNIALESNVDENKNDDQDNNGITVQDQNNNVQSEVEIKENHVHHQEHLIDNQTQESEGFDANFDADFADDQFDQSNHVSNDNNVPIETASPTDQKHEEEKEQEQVETPTLDHEQTSESEEVKFGDGFAADFDADFGADEFISQTPNEQPVNNDEPIKEEITSNITTKEEEFENADFTTDFDSFPEEVTTTDEAPPQTNDSTPTEEPVALTKEDEIEESTQKDIAEEHNDDGFDDADFGDFPEDDVLQTTDAMGDEDFGDFPDFEDISAPDNGSSTLNDEELDEFNDFGNVQDESKDDFGDFDEPETSVEETEPQVTEEEAKEAEREHLLLKQLEQSISSSILSSEHESMSMDNLQQLFTTILMPTTMQYIINGKGLSMERANNRNLSLEKLFKVNSSQNANILSKMAVWSDSCTETQFLKSMGLQRKNNTLNSISKYQRRVATKTATTPRHTRGASSSDGFQDFNRLPSTYTRRPSSSSDQSMSPVVSSANVTDNIFNESSNKVQNESTQEPQQPKPTNSFEDDFDNFGDFPEPTPNAEPATPIASQQQISDDLIAFIDAFSSPRNNSMKTKVVPSKELEDISSLVFTSPAPKTSTARSIQFNQTPTSPVQTTAAPEFEADFGEEFDTDFSNDTKLPDNKIETEITLSPNQEKLQEVQSFGDADFDADFGDFPANEVTQTQTIATNVTEPVDASFDAAFDESDFGEMTGPDHSETEKEQTNATSVSSPTNSIPVEVQQKVDEMLMDLPDLSSILPVATTSQPTSTTGQNFDFLFE